MTATLFGREHPAGLLRAEVDRTLSSHGGLVLIGGEAGIGKTTLVAEAVEYARSSGALVVGGTCWDSVSAPGFWPWVQVRRALQRALTADQWNELVATAGLDPTGWGIVRSAPGPNFPGSPGGSPTAERDADPDREFELFDAIGTLLTAVAQQQPLVIVLDDLHWADPASARLLDFVSRHGWYERLLLIGTYRDVEVDAPGHPLRDTMSQLDASATTITLTGIDEAAVRQTVTRIAGRQPSPELVADLHRRTGGNPFFVEQTARLWAGGHGDDVIAPGVRDAVRRRVAMLAAPVAELLSTAAILGRMFTLRTLSAVADRLPAETDRLLAAAVAARLIESRGGSEYAFVHDLVRETLLADLDDDTRRARHAAVVAAVDRLPAVTLLPGELAGHAQAAGDLIENSRTVEFLVAAARDADSRMATDEAIRLYRAAVGRATDPGRRALIRLDLAGELHFARGIGSAEREAAWREFEAAVDDARSAEPSILARVALTIRRYTDRDQAAADALVRQSHRMLLPGSDPNRPVAALADELITLIADQARVGGDDEALSRMLSAQHDSIWGPGTAGQRIGMMVELESAARRWGDRDMEQYASSLRWVALLELGDPAYLDQFRAFVGLTERYRTPRMGWGAFVDRCVIEMFRGRFAAAHAAWDALAPVGDEDPVWGWMTAHLRWSLLLRQGRYDELSAVFETIYPAPDINQVLLESLAAVESGRPGAGFDAAAAHVRSVLRDGPAYPPMLAALWIRLLALVATATGDAALIDTARRELEPHRGEWCVGIYGCDLAGPVDLYLGLVEIAAGRPDRAEVILQTALRSAERLQTALWALECRVALVRAGRTLPGGGAGAAAAAELTRLEQRVIADAAALAVPHIADRIREVAQPPPISNPPVGSEPPTTAALRRDGAVWAVTFAGVEAHLPDTKGLADLRELLRRPGQEVPVTELLDPAGGPAIVVAARGGGDPVLDEQARTAYRRRLAILDERIDDAALAGAVRARSDAEAERDALLAELRSATGLGGRSRRLGDQTERARKAVTARIRDTLRKLDGQHPALATHLRASVTTGTVCTYRPDVPMTWRLD